MKLLFKLALRNLWRHLRRSFLTVMSIAISLSILLLMQAILEGRNQNIIDKITSTYTGHLQIFSKKYFEDRNLTDQFFEKSDELATYFPPGSILASRIHLPGLISSAEQSLPIVLEGIEPDLEKKITTIASKRVDGSFLEEEKTEDCPSRQIFIGKKLSSLLNVEVGQKLVFMAQAADGTLGNELFLVKGIFDTQSPDFDKRFAYSPLPCVKKVGAFLGQHEIAIHLQDPKEDLKIQNEVSKKLNDSLQLSTWRESMPVISSIVKVNDATLVFISFTLFLVIILGVINSLLMNLFERTKEFGVMMALGVSPLMLRLLIMTECFLMAVLSCVIGTFLGALFVLYFKKFGFSLKPFLGDISYIGNFHMDIIIYPIFLWIPFLKMCLCTIGVVLMAGVYPAYRASKQDPVNTMKG